MNTPTALAGATPLPHWGVIRATGTDAITFLQGQLTNDVAQLRDDEVRLAGFCSAKGRLQASFLVWKQPDGDVLLACAASVLPATLKRLTMFVLRAKCKLSDASAELPLQGAVGADALALAGAAPAWRHARQGDASALRLPDVDGVARCIRVGVPAASPPTTLPLDAWRSLEVRSGIPQIESATVDQFVPQMLNFEIVGGVDFKKGCYPGQEIVARSQYRGTIKRRMFLFESAAPLTAGQEIFHSDDPSQPAGMVVNAAGHDALVEVKLAALDSGSLHASAVDGPALVRRELPYALPIDASLPA